jgi:hypothetical protein
MAGGLSLFGRGDAENGEQQQQQQKQQQLMVNSTPIKFLLFSVLRVSASPHPNRKFPIDSTLMPA